MDGTTDSRKGIQKQKEGEYRAQRIWYHFGFLPILE
jgi:hypothetical protein